MDICFGNVEMQLVRPVKRSTFVKYHDKMSNQASQLQADQPVQRDYERELNEVFGEALKQIDPELMKEILLIARMQEQEGHKLQITNSYSGTDLQENIYAEQAGHSA